VSGDGAGCAVAARFLRTDYIQHNPQVPTGLKGFMETFRERFAQKLRLDQRFYFISVFAVITISK
jgi:predicted SnoaL-like aldol condensation-catalyzing enzyme